MVAASGTDDGTRPTRLNDSRIGWPEIQSMDTVQAAATRLAEANSEVLQEFYSRRVEQAVPAPLDISPQAPQQAEAQQGAAAVSVNFDNGIPLPNTGHGQDRPTGAYPELNAATPVPEHEPPPGVEPPRTQAEPSPRAQDDQQSAEQPPAMTARERHEARVEAFRQGDQQERQAAREEAASLTGGTDASVKEMLGMEEALGVSGPHLGGGMSR